MRRAMLLGALMTLALLLASGVALAATINGTNGPDRLVGTPKGDTIQGFRGDDIIRGKGSGDTLRGYGGDWALRAADESRIVTATAARLIVASLVVRRRVGRGSTGRPRTA